MIGTVLVTGGLGYLGGRIVAALSSIEGLTLRVTTHRADPVLPEILKPESLEYVDFASASASELNDLCRGVRAIIHLAAVNEIDSAADPERAFLVNSLGTLRLLQAAERHGVERFIYFSTAHVYGALLAGTITEDCAARPVHPYSITHRAAEDFVMAAHDRKNLCGIVIRLSNGIGAPLTADINRWTLVGNDLCRQAVVNKKRLELRSSGVERRDFIVLSDVTRAMIHFLNIPVERCADGLFNVGGEDSIAIIDLAGMIASRCEAIWDYRPCVHAGSPQGQAPPLFDYRIDKLKQTGFSLEGELRSEIDATLELCARAFGAPA